jgi:hypothetical protein
VLRNWDVGLHAAWHGAQRDKRADDAQRTGTSQGASQPAGRDSSPAAVETPPRSNLLLHSTRRRQSLSTPHVQLAIDEAGLRDNAAPVALAIHCWPHAPEGLRVAVGWRERQQNPILYIQLRGPLPEHPAAAPLRANLRSTLVSNDLLQNSVLAAGIANEYLASSAVGEAIATADQELVLPTPKWPAQHDELFSEFRLAVAGLAHSTDGVKIELSRFYLGQNIEERVSS